MFVLSVGILYGPVIEESLELANAVNFLWIKHTIILGGLD